MALDNIPTLGPGSLNSNLDKVLVYKNGGSEVAVSLLTLTNSALNLSGVYLDTVNQRVGIYNPSPSAMLSIGSISKRGSITLHREIDGNAVATLSAEQGGFYLFGGASVLSMPNNYVNCIATSVNAITSAMWGIKGSGSTSATTSLLVQNSSGTEALRVRDDLFTLISGNAQVNANLECLQTMFVGGALWGRATQDLRLGTNVYGNAMAIASATGDVSVSTSLTINSTTKGFLKPRLTTVQKNAIVTPTAGLEVYDTDLNRPCFYNGTSWITL